MATYAGECACLRCKTTGDSAHIISSTPEVETRARSLADHLRPLCQDRGRMLGVMVADGEWIVSLSSIASVTQDFVLAVQRFDAGMSAIAHDWSTVPVRSLGGHDLRGLLQPPTPGAPQQAWFKVQETEPARSPRRGRRHALPLAGGPGCICAAPKLISYLTQDAGAALLPPKSLTMVELWCGADYFARRHGAIALSCDNCRRILPTLACRAAH